MIVLPLKQGRNALPVKRNASIFLKDSKAARLRFCSMIKLEIT
jgi:hypothetical protein